ncbi:major facilitator superfamily domain-containing protein [Lophiotrema nucula]|uniref:Major facilitator superfamily domain-containing protein n=1 Tax=Lophiotrema nucula TaxID=690887 RepID=A0A6A5ZJI7_9PLEO|nr:major facilitator superfamily domain-containing protein [Lophiotrema nucula]
MAAEIEDKDIEAALSPAAEKDAEVEKEHGVQDAGQTTLQTTSSAEEVPYTIFTLNEKRFMAFILTFAALFSPISSTIYYPALSPLAEQLHVSNSLINLSITTFMIFQGFAPLFIGAFSDAEGRRPAYVICFVIYIAADIGLALQTNYAALLILRCVQSSGSSGTVSLANAVVADFSLPHERGTWMGWANAGALLGPSIGPIIGGLLSQYLGWRSIFWFLAIFAGVYLLPILLFFPESARKVVGNGSHRPGKFNRCLLDPVIKKRVDADPRIAGPPIAPHPLRFPNPFLTLKILFEPEASLVLISSGFLFAGFYGVMAGLPSQLQSSYGFDPLHVGLCFLASGVGGSVASLLTGKLMDWNFHRHARRMGLDASDTKKIRSLTSFPIEAARLELALPFVVAGSAMTLGFGWTLRYKTYLGGPEIFLFFVGFCCTGAFTTLSTLVVDLFIEQPATATAAMNLTRCFLGAGATAAVVPMMDAIGAGWSFTIIAVIYAALVPPLLAIIRWGPGMRARKDERLKREGEGTI